MQNFINEHPNSKYLFFGGKGGVGKSVIAGATALKFASEGRKTLLTSTNPVHSLSGMLKRDVFGKATKIHERPNLFALEINTNITIEKKKKEIKEKIEWFLRFADISTNVEEFINIATMNPSFEESAMFEEMVDLIFKNEYEVYIFDTAPTANTRRLLGMSSVYKLWVEKMMHSKEDAQKIKKSLSYTEKGETDVLSEYLCGLRNRIDKIHEILINKDLTAFFFVTLPEALPIAVIKRFINWFKEFGIPIGGVLVNGVIPKECVEQNAPEFVLNRVKMQEGYLKEIFSSFHDVRAVIPYLNQEIQGLEMLNELSEKLFCLHKK